MERRVGDSGVRISGQIISPEELHHRVEAVRDEMARLGSPIALAATPAPLARAERLHRLWGTVAPVPVVAAPGRVGAASAFAKRAIRRLTDWNTEPRWSAQHEIDAELARFATDSAAAIERLEAEVAHLQEWNARLQRELRLARPHEGGH